MKSPGSPDPTLLASAHDRLRAVGLRSTPQRQAILSAFGGGGAEHLSADEVFAHASATLPGLSRGTVYATLAEFTEIGLLSAFGTPDPVRYETHVGPHGHFRCRLCLRVQDVDVPLPTRDAFSLPVHEIERVELRAEGTCLACEEYRTALQAGVAFMLTPGAAAGASERPITAMTFDSPLGPLWLAASAAGLTRLAFAEHSDVPALGALVGADAPADAAEHLITAREQLEAYFNGEPRSPVCPIDWLSTNGSSAALHASFDVAYGSVRSYHAVAPAMSATSLGKAFGANPVPIFIPCHRINVGTATPASFVGGLERRTWLRQRERPVRA